MKRTLSIIVILSMLVSLFSAFSVNGYAQSIDDYYISSEQLPACEAAAEDLIGDLIGNETLGDVELALLIHDRLAVHCEYDYENYLNGTIPWDSYRIYGALVNKTAVCQGYAEAYGYLLSKVGIESELCVSSALNHAWNIVYIDGEAYHVDVTWDDPVWDTTGFVRHDNFLRSNSGIYATGHDASDYITPATSTKYDDYFWQVSEGEFCMIGDEIYYLDNYAGKIYRYSDKKLVLDVGDTWQASNGGYWIGHFGFIGTDGKKLYYSKSDAIYSFDPATSANDLVYRPELKKGEYIYGFTYDSGALVYDISDSPNYSETTQRKLRVVIEELPIVNVSISNDLAEKQTVTVKISTPNGIAGYYWVHNGESTFVKTNQAVITRTVSESGIYRVTALDNNGKKSSSASFSLSKLTLSAVNSSGVPSALLVTTGKTVALPTPTHKKGVEFNGWHITPEDYWTTPYYEWTASEDKTFYARFVPKLTLISKPKKTVYYIRDEFDRSGLSVELVDNTGAISKPDVDDMWVSGFDNWTEGVQTVYVSHYVGGYDRLEVSFDVTVKSPSVKLDGVESTIAIAVGESLDLNSMFTTDPEGLSAYFWVRSSWYASVENGILTAEREGSTLLYVETYYNNFSYYTEYQLVISADPHNWDSGVIITEATCISEGEKLFTCLDCGKTQTVEYSDDENHTYGEWVIVNEATCYSTGWRKCTCTNCGRSTVGEMVPMTDHDMQVQSVLEPTCGEDGTVYYRCSICGGYDTEAVSATGKHVPYKEADCENDSVCSVCNKVIEHASGHKAGEWITVQEPSEGKHGLKEKRCVTCGTLLESEYIDSLPGPDYVKGDVNGNGTVDAQDYALAKRHCLKTFTLSDEMVMRADLNGNGKLETSEYALIKRHVLGTYVIK